MIKTVLFDFDGTIADSFESSVEIFNKLSRFFKHKTISQQEIEHLRDLPPDQIIKYLGIGKFKILMLVAMYKYELTKVIADLKPYEGLKEVIARLKQEGYVVGIASSNSEKNIRTFLDLHAIKGIDFIYGNTGLFGKDKTMRRIMKKYGLNQDEILYIGDEVRDIQASRKAGIQVISVLWGDNSEKILQQYNPHFLAHVPQDILHFVRTS